MQELVDDLQLTPGRVNWALAKLRAAELVEVLEERPTAHNLLGFVYGTPLTGWTQILVTVSDVAASRDR